jgi:tRNA dimethylallyltransferase
MSCIVNDGDQDPAVLINGFGEGYGDMDKGRHIAVTDDLQVICTAVQPGYKDGIAWLHKLYEENLITHLVQIIDESGIPHHLIDEFDPEEEFHVVRFQEYAKKYIREISERGNIPILVGGTGFYIQAVLNDIDFTDNGSDTSYREMLQEKADLEGPESLHEMLRQVDPASAEAIHANNVKRVIRALEFYHETGLKISEHNEAERQRTSPYQFAYFVLNDLREKVYENIELRVDLMLEQGLVEEVKALQARGCTRDMVSMQGLGYKEILDYLDGKTTLERAVYLIKQGSRHYAKRQLTWFRREKTVTWINKEEFAYDHDKILAYMEREITSE